MASMDGHGAFFNDDDAATITAFAERIWPAAQGRPGATEIGVLNGGIAAEGRRWGAEVPFLRPAELAQDATPTLDSVLHAAERLERERGTAFDALVLLQPTSPLRTADDIAAVWRAFDPAAAPSGTRTIT